MAFSSSSHRQQSLPIDIVEVILYRVPIESLTRFKSVCKQWLTLFRDKRFIYKHLSFVQQRFLKIGSSVEIINLENEPLKSIPLPRATKGRSVPRVKAHCDGLLLCLFGCGQLAIVNPYIKQLKWILHPSILPPSEDFYYFGIGYKNMPREDGYKIMILYDARYVDTFGNNYEHRHVEILNVKYNSTRSIDSSQDWYVFKPYRCVSLNGNMHWIAKWKHSSDIFIQSFYFSTEKFEPLCSTLPFGKSAGFMALSDFRGDRLSLLHERKENIGIDIWVTSKIKNGVVTSWTKLFNIPVRYVTRKPGTDYPIYFIDKNNRIVLCCEVWLECEKLVCATVYIFGEDGA